MKLLLTTIALCGAMLPFAQAADPVTTYGGFKPGKTFTLKVVKRSSYKVKGGTLVKNVRLPDDVPFFKRDEAVKFTIGSKGQLKGSGFSIAYRSDEDRVNFYANKSTFSSPDGESATVLKTSTNKPTGATLVFYRFSFSGFIPVTNVVRYRFD